MLHGKFTVFVSFVVVKFLTIAPKGLKMNQEPHIGFPKQEIVSGLQ